MYVLCLRIPSYPEPRLYAPCLIEAEFGSAIPLNSQAIHVSPRVTLLANMGLERNSVYPPAD